MKKIFGIMLLLLAISIYSTNQLQAEMKNRRILGEWIYQVSDAPYGYDKGSLVFSEKEGSTICIVKVEAGELQTSNLKIEKKKISFSTEVEGRNVNIELVRNKNKLSGKVDSPEGPKSITALKK